MIAIARITNLEVNTLQHLRAESSREGFKFVERLCAEWASGDNRFNAPGEALFVAVSSDQVVGLCGLNRDPYAHDPHVGRIRRLYVVPAYRRQGVGRALLESAVAHAAGHFSVLRARTDAADQFYTAHGFRRLAADAEATHILELAKTA
jgi:GNAT superfamily N-acetyltransferase